MCSKPITNDVPVPDSPGQCALCDEVFPFVNILSCRRLKGGEIPICMTCHQRFHPGCTAARTVLNSSHYQCRVCDAKRGTIICALCSTDESTDEILEGVLMCEQCSEDIHGEFKQHHSDHFYPVASPAVVSVKGPIHWHNYLDLGCALSANQRQARHHAFQQNTAATAQQQSRGASASASASASTSASASQQQGSSQGDGASGPKPPATGGAAGQSQDADPKDNDDGSMDRSSKDE